jgi:predicted DNA binding CopG/RHH family protein
MEKTIREHTTARIKVSLIEAVKKLATKEGRSYSNQIERLLDTHPNLKKP